MPYPPTLPPTGQTDATTSGAGHHADVLHNRAGQALADIVTELGNDPSGAHASVEARLAAERSVVVPVRATRWHSSPATELALGTALTLDRAHWMPFPVVDPITVDAIGAWAQTAVTGAVYTLALYGSTATGEPGARLELSGAIDAAATGAKTYVFPAVRALTRGLYWTALVNTGAANQSVGYAAAGNEWVSDANPVAAACYFTGGGTAALVNPAPANLSTAATFVNVLLRAA